MNWRHTHVTRSRSQIVANNLLSTPSFLHRPPSEHIVVEDDKEAHLSLLDLHHYSTERSRRDGETKVLALSVGSRTCTPTLPNIPATPDQTLNQPHCPLSNHRFQFYPRLRHLTPSQLAALIEEMVFANPAPSPPPAPARKNKISRPKDDVDDFLSSDLELSFASSMSLISPSASRVTSPVPMDISPAKPQHPPDHLAPPMPRFFGREISNRDASLMNTKPPETKSSTKGRQRAALPTQWLTAGNSSPKEEQSSSFFRVPETLTVPSPGDAMDVDMPSSSPSVPAPQVTSAAPSPTPITANANYSNLFFETSSPEPCPAPNAVEGQSGSPELNQMVGSSDPPSSPSHHKFTRAATIGAGAPLFKKKPMLEYSAPSVGHIPLRRPAISAIVAPTHGTSHYQSIHEDPKTAPLLPVRRAFSAMVPPTAADANSDDVSDIQSSSPAAAYAKRHQARIIRRCDGSDELRPLAGAGSLRKRDRQEFQDGARANGCSPRSLAGFGVKEVEKKILPCHRVSEDGLVRITSDTLRGLLAGTYSSQVSNFTVVDCRFEYEYDGGHIPGAVNLNTTTAIEDYFLGCNKPPPCESGDPSAKTILVFHCEFSVKRAPTFAKHLRSKDRAMNGRVYPKVCYPEIYILEGGFCQFFREYPNHCDPQGYVPMDDPAHIQTRDADLDNFRRGKWKRTQSYAYGESASKFSTFSTISSSTGAASTSREHRNTAPSGGPAGNGSMFAAANAARGRRSAGTTKGLSTLEEDASSSGHEDGDGADIQDSPCPPPSRGPLRSGLLVKTKIGRSGLDRAVSHGATVPTRR